MTSLSTHMVVSPGWVELFATDLPAGTASVRVVRQWRGTDAVLTGATKRPVQDGAWRYLDHALPCSLTPATDPVGYRVEPLSDGGAILDDGVATVSVQPLQVGHSEALLSDPLDPLGGTRVTLMRSGDLAWSASSGDLLGPALGGLPVSTGMTRQREHSISAKTTSAVDAQLMQTMIERGGVLLVRADPSCLDHPTGVLYLHVPSPSRAAIKGPHGLTRRWALSGTECAPPASLALVAARSYADTSSDFPTYAATKAALPTYLQRSRGE